jgi:hypothetical protein
MTGRPAKDLTGRQFGHLTAIKRVGTRRGYALWLCDCICGRQIERDGTTLQRRKSQSCGCAQNIIHGEARQTQRTSEYRAWKGIRQRCLNPNTTGSHNYGGRGITICNRWRFGEGGKTGYECFIADMGRKPSPDHSIERINNDLGYFPGNCKWATTREQAKNRRRRGASFVIGVERVSREEAAVALNISVGELRKRIGEPIGGRVIWLNIYRDEIDYLDRQQD